MFSENSARIDLFNLLTTNFSAAAMVILRSQLLKYFDLHSNKVHNDTELNQILIKLCAKVASDFQIKIGSALSESLSYSIQNNAIWQQIILHSFKAQFAKADASVRKTVQTKSQFERHKWCLLISSSEFLINQFKKLTNFEWCAKEKELKVKERKCANCGQTYLQKDNRNDSCSFHPKKELERIFILNDMSTKNLMETKEGLIKLAGNLGNTDIFNQYYYLCCMKKINESDGCKKDYHMEADLSKKNKIK